MKITNNRVVKSGNKKGKRLTHKSVAKKRRGSGGRNTSRKKKSTSSIRSFFAFFKNEKVIKVYGVLLLAFSVLLLVSLLSYFFHHTTDDFFVRTSSVPPGNIARGVGAHLSYFFINFTFGVAALGFVFLFFIYGLKLIGIELKMKEKSLSLVKITITTLLTMAWISLFLGFWVFDTGNEFIAGSFGLFTSQYLLSTTGKFVTFLIVTVLLLTILILCYQFSIKRFLLLFVSFFKYLFSKFKRKERKIKDKTTVPISSNVATAERQELPGLYMEERNSLNSGINEELYDFESEVEEKETTDKPVRKDVDFEIIEAESIAATMEEDDDEVEEELENSVVPLEPYEPRKDLSAYQFPIPELLKDYTSISVNEDIKLAELRENKERIESTLNSFKIEITKITAIIGPTVTLYEIVPAEGIRISKIKNLENDIALNLAALGIRIIAPIPGKGTIGIEVPNKTPNIVSMKEIIVSEKFQSNKFELPIGLGKTISNEPFVVDLVKMPHLLMAGATGQGKSVGLNAIITSLLYKKHPSELKLVLIDPKKVEFPLYSNIEKHFLAKLPDEEEPIITDTKKVIRTLNSLCIEMDNRYELLKLAKVRNIKEYNTKFCRRELSPTNGHRYLPYIVLIIDEFGDLIMTAGREVEHPLARLAQLARAIGIHLIIATQRPSVKIISGNIKANFPARVAFRVSSRIDSQTILDTTGADQLVGKGDMLLSTGSDLLRLQCAFVDTPEVESVTNYIAEQQSYPEAYMLPEYADSDDSFDSDDSLSSDKLDPCFMDAATLIVQNQQGSTSLIQRRMNLGYNRAGRIMDQLEEFGIVGPPNGSKARDVKVQTLEELRIIFDKIGLL